MRACPPGDRSHARVLHPHQQQQEAEDRLHIDGEQKECVDLERHASDPNRAGGVEPRIQPSWLCLPLQTVQTVKGIAVTSMPTIVVRAVLTSYRKMDRIALPRKCTTFQCDEKRGGERARTKTSTRP